MEYRAVAAEFIVIVWEKIWFHFIFSFGTIHQFEALLQPSLGAKTEPNPSKVASTKFYYVIAACSFTFLLTSGAVFLIFSSFYS